MTHPTDRPAGCQLVTCCRDARYASQQQQHGCFMLSAHRTTRRDKSVLRQLPPIENLKSGHVQNIFRQTLLAARPSRRFLSQTQADTDYNCVASQSSVVHFCILISD